MRLGFGRNLHRRVVPCLVVSAALAVVATGCGVTEEETRPGVAASVAGESLSLRALDDVVADYCSLLADNELIGTPHRVVIGDRGLKEGVVEYQGRRDAEATKLAVADVAATVIAKLKG